MNPISTNNYLRPLIQKGAKNTINISNHGFLKNVVPLPQNNVTLNQVSNLLGVIQNKIGNEQLLLSNLQRQKSFLLMNMFI